MTSTLRRLATSLAVLAAVTLLPEDVSSQRRPPRCSVASTGLSFGGYDVFDPAPLDTVGTVTLECTGLAAGAQVVIELGRGNEREHLRRAMRHQRHALRYQVYLDAARTLVWGDGTGGTSVYRGLPADGLPLSIPMFGRVPALQNVVPGAYADQLMLTVEY